MTAATRMAELEGRARKLLADEREGHVVALEFEALLQECQVLQEYSRAMRRYLRRLREMEMEEQDGKLRRLRRLEQAAVDVVFAEVMAGLNTLLAAIWLAILYKDGRPQWLPTLALTLTPAMVRELKPC